MRQKEIFLESEGDAYFERNHQAILERPMGDSDIVVREILRILAWSPKSDDRYKILEIGCGEGRRLEWLGQNVAADVFGVDPSAKAVHQACERGIQAHVGTADYLPFETSTFDIVVFGFCLYLCDRDDLFKIAFESDRVLKDSGWIVILDFFVPTYIKHESITIVTEYIPIRWTIGACFLGTRLTHAFLIKSFIIWIKPTLTNRMNG